MNQTTEHTESTEPALWRSRWHSAAKRFGLTAGGLWILLFCGMPVGRLLPWIPLLAAAWGAFNPREYERRPSVRARAGAAVLAAGAVAVYVLVAVVGRLLFASASRDWSGEEFTPEIWSSCQRTFHLVPGADLRPVGLRAERWLDAMAQAKFVTDETDLARLFDTNAVVSPASFPAARRRISAPSAGEARAGGRRPTPRSRPGSSRSGTRRRPPAPTAKSPSTPCRTVPAPFTSSGSPTDPADR